MTSPWQITNEWPFELCNALESQLQQQVPDFNQRRDRKTAPGNDKRRKEKRTKKKKRATDPPPKETDNDKCRRHNEIQKFVKMMNGRLSFLEHCIKSKKEFPDLTDDDALVGYQKDYDELSSLKEHKLVGKYLKIFTTSTDEHRIVTDYLKEKCEEFYVINPPDSRPQKIVIKRLPVSTEICEIQADLTSQVFCVEKVAQLTRSKTKSPLPIFMVELQRNPDSPDIFQWSNFIDRLTPVNNHVIPTSNTVRVRIFFSLLTPPFLPSDPSTQWETSRPTNGESSSPVTDHIPSLHFPSQRLVESSLAHWPGNSRPLVERVTLNDPRSHDDPE
ncbi:hypothetical protein TNCV_1579631 [Trichonephila clavipes]|nr:hypothetical protein TNCV_1579631 [Trichonephila clavipes]